MDTSLWGPSLWRVMHVVALNYPAHPTQKQVDAHRTFFEVLQHIIPCGTCATNYAKHIKQVPLEASLENGSKLFDWTVAMHNLVNKELGKPSTSASDARVIHSMVPERGSPWGKGLLVVVLAMLGLIGAIVLVLMIRSWRRDRKQI